jgi:PAS domain S-box-containing protein
MKKIPADAADNPNDEIAALVRTLHETQQRLTELTRGEVDAVVFAGDQSYLLREAQEKLSASETTQRQLAEMQMAILNALPAHIALLDSSGKIVSVNDAWRQFATGNALQGPDFCVGQNYLEICERATGDFSEKAHATAVGIRRLLQGKAKDFALEYPCHSPTKQIWFRLMVTPVREGHRAGAVVTHTNITARKLSEDALRSSEANMAAAQRIAHLGSWELQLDAAKKVDANPLRWSDEMFRIAGFLPGSVKVTNELFFSLIPEVEHAPIRRAVATAIRERKQYSIVHRLIRPNGEERIVHETAQVFFDEQTDQPIKMVGTAHDITERKKAEALLLESEEQFRSMFTAAATGIAISTPDGRFLQANAAYCEMLGYTEDELRTRTFASLTHPDDLTLNLKLRDELLSGQRQSFVMEKRYLKKNGDIVWTHHSVSAAHTASGKISTMIVVAEDITERKRTEVALGESELRHRSLVENMLEGYCYCRLLYERGQARDYIYLKVNDAFEVQTGLKNVAGKKVSAVVPGMHEANPEQLEIYSRVAATCKPERFETFAKRIGIWFSVSVYSYEKGHFIAVFDNITERKRTEGRFRRLVDSNVQGVFFWNTKGEISSANDGFLKLVRHTREDLEAGRINWMAMTPPEYVKLDQRALNELTDTGICATYEKEWLRKDGTRVPILLGAAMFEDKPDEGVCFVLDLTERKKLEQQFLRSQRMESIGTLAGGIAHDLNNILAPIMMSIQVLKDKALIPQAKGILETIEASASRGADVVRQVLSFARGLQGERNEIQPKHLVRELAIIIKDTFPKNIRLEFSIPENIWPILADATQVHQILLNLSLNARDAMPKGGVLSIAVENCILDKHYAAMNLQAQAGRYVRISVTDSGAGMKPEILDKIFEPFFTTKGVGKGTGLGLSTVMAIVKGHEGFVNVYSELGQGATFRVYLPVLESSVPARKQSSEKTGLPRGNGQTILVVDDEASILKITKKMLLSFGYKVLTATNGAEAMAVYSKHKKKIAVVLTDMAMPVMDGAAVILALIKINPKVKIIAASGLRVKSSLTKKSQAKVKHFLSKPYTAETLLNTLRMILAEA